MAEVERWDLTRMGPADIVLVGARLAEAAADARSLEDAAARITASLRKSLWDFSQDQPAPVLARFYRTVDLGDLEPGIRDFAQRVAGLPLTQSTKCLTLMGTAGDEPAWNSRHASQGHRAIPLASVKGVERLPMVAQLIRELGMTVEGAVEGSWKGGDLKSADRVFHIEDAAGSPAVPDQDFVKRHGVRSVVAFGGPLRSGDLWAVILFTRVRVGPQVARLFRILASDVKIALLPLLTRNPFAA